MTALRWEPADSETYDLLAAVAEPHPAIGADVTEIFLAACKRDADAHGGLVSVNRVRLLLADADIPPRRYSSLWAKNTGEGRAMVKAYRYTEHGEEPVWEVCKGSTSGNDGRPFICRRWVGEA